LKLRRNKMDGESQSLRNNRVEKYDPK